MQEDDKAAKAWSGRFDEPLDRLARRFNASVDFDRRLAEVDIQGSLAHARMLAARSASCLPRTSPTIEKGMAQIVAEVKARHLPLVDRARRRPPQHREPAHGPRGRCRQAPAHRALPQRPGGHRHPAVAALGDRRARSAMLEALRIRLLDLAEAHAATLMPGFTHLQVAQPVTFGHHLMAYYEMFTRDAARLADAAQAREPPAARRLRRWRAPATRSTASRSRGNWASTASARTRSTRSRTATSRSNSSPPRRSPWPTCRASPRS